MAKLTFMTLLLALAPLFVQANQGTFVVVKGDIKVESKGKSQKAKMGMKVQEGDTIVAGPDSRAKIMMVDKNVLNISPDSKILIEKYVYNEGADQKNVSLNVLYGKLRSSVQQKYDGEKNTFNVKTPSAVAGVRGTDFLTSFSPVTQATKIVTFEGQVMTGSGFTSSGGIADAVAVNPGQFTVASPGAPPAPPAALPKSELAKMEKESVAEPTPAPGSSGGSSERDPASKKEGDPGKSENGPAGKEGNPNQGPGTGDGSKSGKNDGEREPSGASMMGGPNSESEKTPETVTLPAYVPPPLPPPMPTLPTELQNSGKTKLNMNIQ